MNLNNEVTYNLNINWGFIMYIEPKGKEFKIYQFSLTPQNMMAPSKIKMKSTVFIWLNIIESWYSYTKL